MAKNFKRSLTMGRQINIDNTDAEPETKDAINKALVTKDKSDFIKAANLLENDSSILIEQKKQLQFEFRNNFIDLFKNVVLDLDVITEEINYLSSVREVSFMVIAGRLKLIKEKKLWTNKHESFKDYVSKETSIDYTTALKYIDIINCFGDMLLSKDIEYSKLLPAIPLLKSKNVPNEEKEAIKNDIMFSLDRNRREDIDNEMLQFKEKYGLNKKRPEKMAVDVLLKAINILQSALPENPTDNDKNALRDLITILQGYLEL